MNRTSPPFARTRFTSASWANPLVFDFAKPTGYGLGRSGWISARFWVKDEPDLDLLKRWIVESYRAVAPKKLSKELPES